MGTIGHHTLLFDMNNWQIRAAIRGYYRQQRNAWETSRFSAYVTACSFCGTENIKSPQDLIKFSWDITSASHDISDEDIQRLTNLIDDENGKLREVQE